MAFLTTFGSVFSVRAEVREWKKKTSQVFVTPQMLMSPAAFPIIFLILSGRKAVLLVMLAQCYTLINASGWITHRYWAYAYNLVKVLVSLLCYMSYEITVLWRSASTWLLILMFLSGIRKLFCAFHIF